MKKRSFTRLTSKGSDITTSLNFSWPQQFLIPNMYFLRYWACYLRSRQSSRIVSLERTKRLRSAPWYAPDWWGRLPQGAESCAASWHWTAAFGDLAGSVPKWTEPAGKEVQRQNVALFECLTIWELVSTLNAEADVPVMICQWYFAGFALQEEILSRTQNAKGWIVQDRKNLKLIEWVSIQKTGERQIESKRCIITLPNWEQGQANNSLCTIRTAVKKPTWVSNPISNIRSASSSTR